jgi:hypothetical protein
MLYRLLIITLLISCASSQVSVSTGIEKTQYLQPLQRARYFQSQPNIRIYVYDEEKEGYLYPLFEKGIITPESFSERFKPPYKLTRNDSNFNDGADFDFDGKIIIIWEVEFVEMKDYTKVNITVSEGLQDFKVYCFSFETDETKTIKEQLEQMQKLEQPIKVCHGYL